MWLYVSFIFNHFFLLLICQNLATSDVTPHHPANECTPQTSDHEPSNNIPLCPNECKPHTNDHEPSNNIPLCRSATFSNLTLKPIDCEELLQLGYNTSGVYNIWPRNKLLDSKALQVFCDMETDGGGWTVLQRRGNFLRLKDYFYKDWASYKSGFGNVGKDFWLGNDNIFALTNQRKYSIRFDLTAFDGEYRYALYDVFFIDNEERQYKLTIEDYSGTANDSMIEGAHNGQKFSTKDVDNDNHNDNCATMFKGAWWYNSCHTSNLNGLYFQGKHDSFADGVDWSKWRGYHESLEKTEMKIRPKSFEKHLL